MRSPRPKRLTGQRRQASHESQYIANAGRAASGDRPSRPRVFQFGYAAMSGRVASVTEISRRLKGVCANFDARHKLALERCDKQVNWYETQSK